MRASSLGKVAHINNTDYYSGKTLVSPDLIAFHAKRDGLDPDSVFDQVYFVASYNELRQEKDVSALVRMAREEPTTKPIIVHNITRLLPGAKDKRAAVDALNRALLPLWQLAAQRKIELVMTAYQPGGDPLKTPKAMGSSMLWHLASVMVFFRELDRGRTVHAVLVKHPSRARPASASVVQGDEPLMGRVTPSFGQTYLDFLERIRKGYVQMLRDFLLRLSAWKWFVRWIVGSPFRSRFALSIRVLLVLGSIRSSPRAAASCHAPHAPECGSATHTRVHRCVDLAGP